MKKIIAILLSLLLALSLTVPASAATTMRWDWDKALQIICNAATQIIQKQQTEPTEIPETEYNVVGETEAIVSKTEMVEPMAETTVEREQSWRDWLRRWSWFLEGWK